MGQTPKILQEPNSSSNRSIPCSSQRTSQGLGWSSKRQTLRSSRSYLPKNQEPHCSMEIVLRTNSTRSKLTGKLVWLQESQNFQSSLLVFTVNVLTNVLVLKRD